MTPPEIKPIKFQEIADSRSLDLLGKISASVADLANYVRSIRIRFPEIYHVVGSVDVASMPPIRVDNLKDLIPYFENLIKQMQHTSVSIGAVGNIISQKDDLKTLQSLPKQMTELIALMKKMEGKEPTKISLPDNIGGGDFSEAAGWMKKLYEHETSKPTFVPPAVTNVSLNPLRGVPLSTAITVGTTATALPSTPLSNRRTLIVYNNDSSATLYLGGSGVTTASGFPVAAGSYSPPIDAGPNMVVYGVSSGSINIRVFEVSNTAAGG